MDKHLRFNKKVLMLFVAFLLGMGTAWAYDFSAVTSGNTLYYRITNQTNNAAAGNLVIEDGGQLIANNAVLGTAKKTIVAFTSADDGWNFIASPVTTSLTAANVSGFIPTNAVYDFYYLEEASSIWRNYKPKARSQKRILNLKF